MSEEEAWATKLAGRLRVVQSGALEFPPVQRQELLHEEVERAVKDIPAFKRGGYLLALSGRFPAWQEGRAPAPRAAEPAPAAERLTAAQLLERFLAEAEGATQEQRQQFLERLTGGGFAPPKPPGADVTLPDDVARKAGFAQSPVIPGDRAARLLATLLDVMLKLDQVAGSTWRQISPKAASRQEYASVGSLRFVIEKFVAGDEDYGPHQLVQATERTRSVIAGLLGASGRPGRKFARDFLDNFTPQRIKDVVGPGGLIGPSQGEKCWRKYEECFRDYETPEMIDKRIKDSIADFVEELIGRRG